MRARSTQAETDPRWPRFASKIDTFVWLTLGLVIGLGFVAAPLAVLYLTKLTDESSLTFFFLAMPAAAALVSWMLVSTGYKITNAELIARSGPFRWRVPLAAIESVTASHAIDGALALSLDRLEIRHSESKYGLLVSPKDRQGFLEALSRACPQLKLVGDSLVRS